jgi:ornithine cyclodeaminase/alanine dehydrogenase-like protein (mu-crystallin family)
MSATAEYLGLAGWKQYTTTRHGARFWVGLHDLDGDLLALIDANRLGQLRTGAATAVAVRHMAAADADRLGLIGAGWQAESQLAAVCHVRPIRHAVVYCRSPERRAEFAARMGRRLGIEVIAADSAGAATAGMPIVITATNSREPVVDGSLIAPGAVLCAIGSNWPNRAEVDAETVARADPVVCDDVRCCQIEAGDLILAQEQGLFDWRRAVDLAEIVAGRADGRPRNNSFALFKSVGLALEDVAVGAALLERLGQSE